MNRCLAVLLAAVLSPELAGYQIATAEPNATTVGRQVLESGGNACDAAVAVGFTLAVTYPQAGNLGGGGFALIKDDRGERFWDFRETAPGAATREMYLDPDGRVIPEKSLYGGAASGIPGTVAGLYAIHADCGSIPVDTLIEYAEHLAREGFMVPDQLAEDFIEKWDILKRFSATREVFGHGGRPLRSGDRLVQADLASTLREISRRGPNSFYRGDIAHSLVREVNNHGGIFCAEDLETYKPILRHPVSFDFRGYRIIAAPLPSSGGICLHHILRSMELVPPDMYYESPAQYWRHFITSCQSAYADRAIYLGDPDFYPVPRKMLLDPFYPIKKMLDLDFLDPMPSDCIRHMDLSLSSWESGDTTHYSIIDDEGRAVSLTYTLNGLFGSGLMVEGFLVNNEMDDFAASPGVPNLYGLVGAEANAVAPGKRPLSSMSPTLVMSGNDILYALGTPGGSRIITAVAQVLLHLLDGGLPLNSAVAKPRIHHQWLPDTIYVEPDFSVDIRKEFQTWGYHIVEEEPWCNLQAAGAGQEPVSDPRGYGLSVRKSEKTMVE